jgi:hypothetical protein
VTGSWRELRNEGLHNLYPSPSIIRMVKSSGMRRAWNAESIRIRGMHIGYWWETQKEKTTTKN